MLPPVIEVTATPCGKPVAEKVFGPNPPDAEQVMEKGVSVTAGPNPGIQEKLNSACSEEPNSKARKTRAPMRRFGWGTLRTRSMRLTIRCSVRTMIQWRACTDS